MMRLLLFFLLSLPLIQGFGVVRPAFQQRTAALHAETPNKEVFTSFSSNMEEVDEPAIEKEPYFIGEIDESVEIDDEPPLFKKEEISAKAQETMKVLSSKAEDLMNDIKLKELSGKATEFTKDFFGSIFTQVGDKLKEMKAEKEAAKK